MNTKQIIALCIGIVIVVAAMAWRDLSSQARIVSSQQITPNIGIMTIETRTTPMQLIWPGAATALTLGAIYMLRTRKSA